MSYTVKLAIFPPWKVPVPLQDVGTYPTFGDASAAGEQALAPIAERELAALAPYLNPASAMAGGRSVAVVSVPDEAVHGYVIYDAAGVEVGNWTTLDVAVERAAGQTS